MENRSKEETIKFQCSDKTEIGRAAPQTHQKKKEKKSQLATLKMQL